MAMLKIILFHVLVSNLSRTIVGYVRGEDTVVKERLWKYKYSLCCGCCTTYTDLGSTVCLF